MKPTPKQKNAILLNLPYVSGHGWDRECSEKLTDLTLKGNWDPNELSIVVYNMLNWYRHTDMEKAKAIKEFKEIIDGFPSWALEDGPSLDYGKLEEALDLILVALDYRNQPPEANLKNLADNFIGIYMGMPESSSLTVFANIVRTLCDKAAPNFRIGSGKLPRRNK